LDDRCSSADPGATPEIIRSDRWKPEIKQLRYYTKERIPMAKAKAEAPVSEKREYKTVESAALQKTQWEKKGYSVTRKGNILYIKKG
jgi:hypothetical protein